ncbi:MAG: PCRF domain-containing protein, partial [Rhodospirillales bacterium]
MTLEEKFDRLLDRYAEIGAQLSLPETAGSEEFARLSKEYSDLGTVVAAVEAYRRALAETADLEGMVDDDAGDPELRQMARDEVHEARHKLVDLERQVRLLLIPKDEADEKDAILEVRAGTGGEEAALFAAVLFRMYQRYAEIKGWRFEMLGSNETGIGGLKEASAAISGRGVFARLKFESGVHRVQRVPETEASGRIHTSAATVAV